MCISIMLINIIKAFLVNATLYSVILGVTIILCAIMYVDGTDLVVTGTRYDDYKNVRKKAQILASKWCRVLHIIGGTLRPENC